MYKLLFIEINFTTNSIQYCRNKEQLNRSYMYLPCKDFMTNKIVPQLLTFLTFQRKDF